MSEIKGQIYKITNISTKKIYIGQCVSHYSNGRPHGYLNRWKIHVKDALNKNECRCLGSSIKEYGENTFNVELITECKVSEMNFLEDKYIKEYNTLSPNGYNLMTGGRNGRLHSEETKQKMSITRTGKKHSDETKKRIGESNKNQIVSEKTREIQSSQRKLRDMKDETKSRVLELLKELNITSFPQYLCYKYSKKRDTEGFYICKHPKLKGKTKYFFSKYESMLNKYNKAISYLESLKALHDN